MGLLRTLSNDLSEILFERGVIKGYLFGIIENLIVGLQCRGSSKRVCHKGLFVWDYGEPYRRTSV